MSEHDSKDPFGIGGIGKNFAIPDNMRAAAEAGFEQARKAFENFVAAAQKTASTFEDQSTSAQVNARELGSKAIAYAEANIKSSLDYAENLVKAKDMAEILRLHSEHVQRQMRALTEQATEIGQAVTKAAMDVTKPKS